MGKGIKKTDKLFGYNLYPKHCNKAINSSLNHTKITPLLRLLYIYIYNPTFPNHYTLPLLIPCFTMIIQPPRLAASAALLLLLVVFLRCSDETVSATNGVPAIFVFGDSLVDVGNNNFLRSVARANYYPYGIDFLSGPTGRFSNGRTVIDMFGIVNLSS